MGVSEEHHAKIHNDFIRVSSFDSLLYIASILSRCCESGDGLWLSRLNRRCRSNSNPPALKRHVTDKNLQSSSLETPALDSRPVEAFVEQSTFPW